MSRLLAFTMAFLVTLAIVLIPVSVLEVESQSPVNEYEYEVLSGIDPGAYNLKITTGWHVAHGLDVNYDKHPIAGNMQH